MSIARLAARRLIRLAVTGLAAGVMVMGAAPIASGSTSPPTPFNFYVNRVTDTQVSMQWSPGYITEPTRWRVYQNDQLVATRISSSYVASGLVPGGTYSYYVVAVDQSGDTSAPTRTITVTTRGPGVELGAPSNLRADEVRPARVTLTFDKPGDEFDVWSYQVFDGANPVTSTFAGTSMNSGTVTVDIRRLEPGSAHTFTVRALRSGGLSAPSNEVAVMTPARTDFEPPSTPSGLTGRLVPYTCDSAELKWSQSTDNVDAQSGIDYEIFVNGTFAAAVRGTGTGAVLLPGVGTHAMTVRAIDSSGNASGFSNSATVTIDPFCEA